MVDIKSWFKRKRKVGFEVDRSMGYSGPAKPRVKTARTTMTCQYVRLKNGETGALIGPWILNGKWDGSYTVIHSDATVGYYFPSFFEWTGLTIEEAIAIAEVRAEQEYKKKKSGQKEMEAAA